MNHSKNSLVFTRKQMADSKNLSGIRGRVDASVCQVISAQFLKNVICRSEK